MMQGRKMMQEIKFMFKSLQLLPNFNGDPKKYNTWKQKLGIIASLKPDELEEPILIKLVCTKMEGQPASGLQCGKTALFE